MTQLFSKQPEYKDLHEVYLNAKRVNFNDLQQMHSDIIGSRSLGQAIFDSGALNFSFAIDQDYFLDNYVAIIAAMQNAGTFETYITLIKNLIGQNSQITFEVPKPGHLKIKVLEADFREKKLYTSQNLWLTAVMADGTKKGIIATNKLSAYTLNQATNVIKNLTPDGIYVEVSFRGDQ